MHSFYAISGVPASPGILISDEKLTLSLSISGEFSRQYSLAPTGYSLHSPGLLLLFNPGQAILYYTTTLCDLQGRVIGTVEMRGLEPLTSTVRLSRSSS